MLASLLLLPAATVAQVKSPHEGYQCHLVNSHTHDVSKPVPALAKNSSGDGPGLCAQYQDNACCSAKTAGNLHDLYGSEKWAPDRCQKLSPACEAAFVEENCGYECDVNWGRYRHHEVECGGGMTAKGGNTWQISGMPVSVSILCIDSPHPPGAPTAPTPICLRFSWA
eukprot:COSAG05_NODE_781_length_7373_cov_4.069838_4_plen_168_part_00